ncbi:MAG: gamma carbonic anhydrase family protein [Candidatus Jordarchaeum sp.]|uniref:gamma carbonic anhydrase family protein n=1 Tax=Candidatus Jordarchaeum sp. TaxID=2823881 RepID=UPI004049589D
MSNEKEGEILKPKIHKSVFIAEGAQIWGDVEIGEGSSVWFNAVIRGDEGKITIGKNTNIQDNTVLHSDMLVGIEIGDNVTIGHGAIIRGCKIGNNSVVGMNSTVMTNSEIGDDSIVGANTFVPYDKKFPPRSLIIGMPAKIVRELKEGDLEANKIATQIYKGLVKNYSEKKILGYGK